MVGGSPTLCLLQAVAVFGWIGIAPGQRLTRREVEITTRSCIAILRLYLEFDPDAETAMSFLISSSELNGESLLSPVTARTCPDCGAYTHPWEDHGDLKKKLKQDWSVTNDGLQIVSKKFKTIVEAHAVKGVEFRPLSNGSFVFRVLNVVYFDMREAFERSHGICQACGRLRSFLGIPPQMKLLPGQKPIGLTDIVRSGTQFGSDTLWHDLVVFGEEIQDALNADGLRGRIYWYSIGGGA